MKEGAYWAQQFDPSFNGVIQHAIQPQHVSRLIQGQVSQDLVNPKAGQYSATAMGPGQQIPQLGTFTLTQIIQQFYSGQLIPRPLIQQPFQEPLLVDPTYFWLQYLIILISKHYHQVQQAIQHFNQVFKARTLNKQTCNIAKQPTIRSPTLMQQQQNQAREPVNINGRQQDSPGTALTRRIAQDQQPLWNRENSY
ncbi:MAG: hypothetical protein EZS28_020441 [Streblomastix strix]|uniref:Uncharacterized protein n=1 Tax=Streblomastix strix TaxID=222440 RepID=A0A5J4VN36_9EUKA|nr:MAG: hypothetical protein EZS28_020441 [Streblomastix strix]